MRKATIRLLSMPNSRVGTAVCLRLVRTAATLALGAPLLELLAQSGFDDSELALDGAMVLVEVVRFAAHDYRPSSVALVLVALSFALGWARAPLEMRSATRSASFGAPSRPTRWLAERFLWRAAFSILESLVLASCALRATRYGFDVGTVALLASAVASRPLSLILEARTATLGLERPEAMPPAPRSRWREVAAVARIAAVDLCALLVGLGNALVPEGFLLGCFFLAEGILLALEVHRLRHLTTLASASVR